MADGQAPRVRRTSPPAEGDGANAGGGGSSSRRSGGNRSKLDKLEQKLAELFSTFGMAQGALSLATGDPRHARGAAVSNQFAEPLAHAWVELAKENAAVARILERLVEGSAWGGVIMTSAGFVYSQAQAYEVLPAGFPNPWARGEDGFVPPSDDVMAHAAAAAASGEAPTPPVGKDPRNSTSGVDEPLSEAEKQRREVEERRKARGS